MTITKDNSVATGWAIWVRCGNATLLKIAIFTQLILVAAEDGLPAQEVAWETGARLERVLAEQDRLSLSDQPLRDSLNSLEQVYRVCIFLDRRVDPSQRVTVSSAAIPLRERVSLIAESLQLGSAELDWGMYIGPRETAIRLATLTAVQQQTIRGLDRTVQRRLMADQPLQWPRLAQPRQIAERLARDYQVRIEGLEAVSFDLWSERNLPEMDFPSALTLVLAGFDSAYDWREAGSTAILIPFPTRVSLEEVYRLPDGRQPPLAQWRKDHSDATLVVAARELKVSGPIEAHRAVKDWIEGRPTRVAPRPDGEKRLTLKIGSATLKQATDYLAKELELSFDFAPEAEAKLAERISLEVTDALLETLLQKLFDPLELSFEITGRTIKVTAKSPE